MKYATKTARLSSGFIDFVLLVFVLAVLSLGGIGISKLLNNRIAWFHFSWDKSLIEAPFFVYQLSGTKEDIKLIKDRFAVQENALLDTTIIEGPSIEYDYSVTPHDLFYEVYFDIGYQSSSDFEKAAKINEFFQMNIKNYIPYQEMNSENKARFKKSYLSKLVYQLETDVQADTPQRADLPISDRIKDVIQVLSSDNDAFLDALNQHKVLGSQAERYLVEQREFYIMPDKRESFQRYVARFGKHPVLSDPDKALVEINSIDFTFILSLMVVILLYFVPCIFSILITWAILESSRYQGTPGKILIGLKVIEYTGDRISYDRAFKRALLRLLSVLWLGLDRVILDGNKRLFFTDRMSISLVVYKDFQRADVESFQE